jgi:hypothetical protein
MKTGKDMPKMRKYYYNAIKKKEYFKMLLKKKEYTTPDMCCTSTCSAGLYPGM